MTELVRGIRPRLVCIEDDGETLSLIAEEFEDRGFSLSAVSSSSRAIPTIIETDPDLVLCDVNMPVLSGFDILEKLHANFPAFSRTPFVFLTALCDKASEVRGRRLGADDYVTKPVDFDVLELIINRRLARAEENRPSVDLALKEKEAEALTWAARGKSSDEIALILGIGKRAVDFHIDSARVKLGASTRIQAAVKATACHLIKP